MKLYFMTFEKHCLPFINVCDGFKHFPNGEDELCNDKRVQDNKENSQKLFECDSGKFIPEKYVNDLIPDCEYSEDETNYYKLSIDENYWLNRCESVDMLPCESGTTTCFNRKHICMYDKDENNALMFCRNGAHLLHCKDFQCSASFKCSDSYCIPYKRVCDGINDCQDGQDEGFCENYVCRGMFKCKNQTFCISQVSVCDGVADCPFEDDELNCEKFRCLRGCDCLNMAIFCQDIDLLDIFETDIGPLSAKYIRFWKE